MEKNERRLLLLRAARRVFATKGYHDTKVDDIVAAAEVAKGTFYLYFQDKRSLFVELVDSLFRHIETAILRVDVEADVAEQVKHNIRAILTVLLEEPETTQMMLAHASGLDTEFATKISSFYDGVKTLLCESLKDGQKLGIVAQGDPRLLATFTIGALKEVLQEVTAVPEPLRQREKVVTEMFKLLEAGYLRVQPAANERAEKGAKSTKRVAKKAAAATASKGASARRARPTA